MISRRQFLRGDFKNRPGPQRPPWTLAEETFVDQCTRCGACNAACPTRILVVVRGYPEVDFKRGECSFCGACVESCRTGALRHGPKAGDVPPWSIKARIAETCVPRRGVECRICGEHCMTNAIRFNPRLGGPSIPEVSGEACTGCGACVAPCPVAAITVV